MRSVAILLAFIAGLAGTACTKHNALSCNDGVCSDPNFPFCDESGQFGEGANTCIAVTCTPSQFQACHGDDALACNAVGNDYDVMHCPVACEDDKGGCVACTTDGDCSAGTPHCSPDGACVACLDSSQCSDPTKPYCDDDAHACRGCAVDDECDSRVCDGTTGTCVDSANVIYAAPDGLTANCGTLAVPCSFQEAMIEVSSTNNLVKLLPGTYGGITITKSFTLHGDGATLTGEMDINGTLTVTIVGLSFDIPADPMRAIQCMAPVVPPTVNLDRVSVTVPRFGVLGCKGAVTRSTFKGSTQGILLDVDTVSRSHFTGGGLSHAIVEGDNNPSILVENCVFENANPATFGGSNTTIRFSTFFNASVSGGGVNLVNDIMVSTTATPVETGTCQHHYVVSMPAVTAQPGDDHVVTADPEFKDAVHGDFHLTAGSPAIDSADPQANTMIDFDGATRPQGNGRDIGAFEYMP